MAPKEKISNAKAGFKVVFNIGGISFILFLEVVLEV